MAGTAAPGRAEGAATPPPGRATVDRLDAPTVGGRLQVTQVRSSISTKPKHRGTLRALGLRRIGATNDLPDRPEIRGMIARVPHLVAVSVRPAPATRGSQIAESEHPEGGSA